MYLKKGFTLMDFSTKVKHLYEIKFISTPTYIFINYSYSRNYAAFFDGVGEILLRFYDSPPCGIMVKNLTTFT